MFYAPFELADSIAFLHLLNSLIKPVGSIFNLSQTFDKNFKYFNFSLICSLNYFDYPGKYYSNIEAVSFIFTSNSFNQFYIY